MCFFFTFQDDPHANMVIEAIKNDKLHQMERDRYYNVLHILLDLQLGIY